MVAPFAVYEGAVAPAFERSGAVCKRFVDGRLLGDGRRIRRRVKAQWLLDDGYLAVRGRR